MLTLTDIKLDNILVNYGSGNTRFSNIELANLSDIIRIDPKSYLMGGEYGPEIRAAIFRSPEAMLNLRWGTSTDIWSFGATLISLIWGQDFWIFKPDPKDATLGDEGFLLHVLARQIAVFGPAPASYADPIADEDDARWSALGGAIQIVSEDKKAKPFALAKDKCLTEADKEFVLKIIKLDPRESPTARQLVQDKWLNGVP